MRMLFLNGVTLACLMLMQGPAIAAEPYEGDWVKSLKECSSKNDGLTSLTVIDLKVNVDGKPLPMVEQYENHCFIDKRSTTGSDTTLSATCYEFWDDHKKKVNARRATIKLSLVSKDALKIDGKPYRRCQEKGAKKKG